jgi:DNA-binding transcriptional LysR family regulator
MNFRTLDLNLLRVFDVVMTERSLTRAAQTLSMTQPAVSNAMKRLRDAIGDDLVVRSGYGVEPTAKALALWPTVRDSLASLQAHISPDPFDPKTTPHSFTLALADSTAAMLMPHLVREIESLGSKISIRSVPLTTRDPRRLLEASAFDLAVGYFPGAVAAIVASEQHQSNSEAPNHFGHTRLYSGEYVCVMRKGHRLAKRHALTLDEYCTAHHLLVSFSGRPFGLVDEALASINRKRLIVLTVNQFFTAGRVVIESDLLAVLPRHFLSSTGIEQDLAVFDLPFDVAPVHIDMVWHTRNQKNTAHQWLRSTVGEMEH